MYLYYLTSVLDQIEILLFITVMDVYSIQLDSVFSRVPYQLFQKYLKKTRKSSL